MLRAFAESDEELREAFYSMAREQARTGRMLRADELPAAVQRLMGDDGVELERVLPLLSTSVTELVGSWERMLGLLLAYREREGHCDVPDRHVEDGARLGGWLQNQRQAYKARGMSEEERKAARRHALPDAQVEALEALGVVWEPRGVSTS